MTLEDFLAEWNNDSDRVLVHTSGSTGEPKPLLVEKRRMEASALTTCRFLGLKEGDSALLCLPLDFIAGKMMVVRALACGMRLVSVPPSGHPLACSNSKIDFAAMVPMQVWNSLQVPDERERLRDIRHLIIGGGAVDDDLAAELRQFPNAVWSTYGMTETLSHIALRRLSGEEATEWYTPLPGVAVSLAEDSCLTIEAPAVCQGTLVTNDICELLPGEGLSRQPRFRILGRRDNVICSGGIKIQAEEVERMLKPHMDAPFCITRKKDKLLGQAVTLLTERKEAEQLRPLCEKLLPRLWRPRHYVTVERLPMTATGKIARKEAERIVNDL